MERCSNCERVIGKLETAFLWQNNVVVCKECHSRLSDGTLGRAPRQSRCCPSCQSAQVASLHMIHQGGTSTGRVSGLTLNSEGSVGGFGGSTTSQSTLAAMAAPPTTKGDGVGVMVIAGGGLAFVMWLWSLLGGCGFLVIGIGCAVVLAVFALLGAKHRRWNREEFPGLLNRWQLTWMCLQCGTRFVPAPSNE